MNINRKFSSPNYSARRGLISFVVIHFTEINFEETLERLCDPQAKVSAHYVIKSDGEIFSLVDDLQAAWHAGISYWKTLEKLNEYSIGIELDNDGKSNFSKEQMNSCVTLCQHLKNVHNIKTQNFIGHSDIAPDRKIDPGILFDWPYLAKFDLGAWHNIDGHISSRTAKILLEKGQEGPQVSKLQTDLYALGYKIEETGVFDLQTNYVIRAFQAHFHAERLQNQGMDFYWSDDSKYTWDEKSELILQDLLKASAA